MKALALVRDLFFRAKIDAVAAVVGAEVEYASSLDAVAARCAAIHPSIIFTDLSDATFPALDTLKQIRAAAPSARAIGFASHVDLKSSKSRPRRRLRPKPSPAANSPPNSPPC